MVYRVVSPRSFVKRYYSAQEPLGRLGCANPDESEEPGGALSDLGQEGLDRAKGDQVRAVCRVGAGEATTT